ncbi:hypothetical protein [Aquimarina celericrescens]|uniref:Phospholipase C/D domain-containing protein n=1 Tax=Aquimarina celericrescens TaxID=1964542 RepID=A0ABW5AX56_9FLAO|nr:hypothetical protein [Aquimarina celericrescens]
MSERITHIAVAEDCARLVSLDPEFSKTILNCIQKFPEALRLGSVSRSGDKFILPLLEKWRDDWKNDDLRSEKMSYVLGWSGHLAADRIFKPICRITNLDHYVEERPSPSNSAIYHDVVTFTHVFDLGTEEPFHPHILSYNLSEHSASRYLPVSKIEKVISGKMMVDLAQIKTFFPKTEKQWKEDWKSLNQEKQSFYVDLDRYSKAYYNGDAYLINKLIEDPNVYNPKNEIIQLVRNIKNKETPKFSLEEALAKAEKQSLYAQALKLGHQFMRADSDFFEKKINIEVASKRHRRGEKHKQKLQYYIDLVENQNKK